MTGRPLDIAFAIHHLVPAGGLERHCLRLAQELFARGHRVTIYTTAAGQMPEGVARKIVPQRGWSNHGRLAAFARDFAQAARAAPHDLWIGFQKMPGLDVLFCADWCFVDRRMPAAAKFLPRYRVMTALEKSCFGKDADTRLLLLARPQAEAYRRAYDVEPQRMTVLPPTLDRRRITHRPPDGERQAWRDGFGVGAKDVAWLWIGLQPKVKGLDRVLAALQHAPGARLIVCGADADNPRMVQAASLARRLRVAGRVRFVGSVDDATLNRLYLCADLLVHPARLDVTGTVIVEALGAGLPVIVTDNCGYAPHVQAAGAGVVLRADATPKEIADAAAAGADRRDAWSAAARTYASIADLTGGIAAAASAIERVAGERARVQRAR